jgi:hypothetical protein
VQILIVGCVWLDCSGFCGILHQASEVVDVVQQTQLVSELDGHVMRCVRDQNGNHVIQKCIECVPPDRMQCIISAFYNQVVVLSTHPYGCWVSSRWTFAQSYKPKLHCVACYTLVLICLIRNEFLISLLPDFTNFGF